ncbi:uncharacterized protein isoform X2 [Takifugu rubripes]|uniref:uncharacterized protein isoform X2 n=1 Tax=Takifugu rubripes TaxID=31033 RepID=UPI0011457912|nr:uncharacterized protein LOC105417810 isoform X2 [Takifugu rubripes]
MHSITVDNSGSPRKRTLSRGISEDESLRSIITETESSSRRLTRSESRTGTLKRISDSQSDQELFMGLPEMLELQASYDEVVQELRGLEVERETLLFQVDVLQDTLESVEELLAEAQRDAGQANLALDQEREAKRKLESMVCSLMQEVERLKEERNNEPAAPVKTGGADEPGSRAVLGSSPEEEDEGNVFAKLRRMVSKPLNHVPSLALDNPLAVDGILRRPYENEVEEREDDLADQNDTDSAYEDASAETPEQDRLFPGTADTQELQRDPESSTQISEDKNQDPKVEQCVVS